MLHHFSLTFHKISTLQKTDAPETLVLRAHFLMLTTPNLYCVGNGVSHTGSSLRTPLVQRAAVHDRHKQKASLSIVGDGSRGPRGYQTSRMLKSRMDEYSWPSVSGSFTPADLEDCLYLSWQLMRVTEFIQ